MIGRLQLLGGTDIVHGRHPEDLCCGRCTEKSAEVWCIECIENGESGDLGVSDLVTGRKVRLRMEVRTFKACAWTHLTITVTPTIRGITNKHANARLPDDVHLYFLGGMIPR